MSRILICLAVIAGMVLPAAGANDGHHSDGSRAVGHVGHDHSPSIGGTAVPFDGDRIGGIAPLSCDPAAGHCFTGFMLPSQPALRLPAVRDFVHRFSDASAWSHQMPDTATPPPRV